MRSVIRLFVVSITLAVAVFGSAKGEDPQTRKEIQQTYAKWDKAVNAQDMKGCLALIDPSFVGTTKEGKTATYAQMKAQMQAMAKTASDFRSQITVNQVQQQGAEVVAWVT